MFVSVWGVKRGYLRFAAAACVWLLSFAVVLTPDTAERIYWRVLRYQSWQGHYGLALVLPSGVHAVLFYAAMFGLVPLLARRMRPADALAFSATVFHVLTPGYFPTMAALWMIALLAAKRWLMAIMVIAVVALLMATGLDNVRLTHNVLWVLAVGSLIVGWNKCLSIKHVRCVNRMPQC